MKKLTTTAVALAAALAPVAAQEADSLDVKPSLRVRAEVRADFQQQWDDGELNRPESGFKGKYLNIYLDGNLNRHFSYAIKHRLDKSATKHDFFEATPWAYSTYRPINEVEISAGKQVVCIGGYEYDRSPADIFFASEYWNNISCYQFGVSAAYNFGKDKITFQVVQSPFHMSDNGNMYAYNIQWNGHHGPWQTIWSVNLSEYARGHYIPYISLGNKFNFNPFTLELDIMNRPSRHTSFLSDCSIMADAGVYATRWLRPFAKFTYDVNRDNYGDLCVLPGTEIKTVGGGFEAWPLLKKNMEVRLHADLCYSWGKNGNPYGVMTDKRLWLNLGVTWSMTLCDIRSK